MNMPKRTWRHHFMRASCLATSSAEGGGPPVGGVTGAATGAAAGAAAGVAPVGAWATAGQGALSARVSNNATGAATGFFRFCMLPMAGTVAEKRPARYRD